MVKKDRQLNGYRGGLKDSLLLEFTVLPRIWGCRSGPKWAKRLSNLPQPN